MANHEESKEDLLEGGHVRGKAGARLYLFLLETNHGAPLSARHSDSP